MKTYTFKIKLQYPKEKHPVILSVVHCPLEVLFDSLKEVKQFDELFTVLNKPENKDIPLMYITASDYSIDDDEFVNNDYVLCKYNAVIESKSLKEFLTHSDYVGFVYNLSTMPIEKDFVEGLLKNEV